MNRNEMNAVIDRVEEMLKGKSAIQQAGAVIVSFSRAEARITVLCKFQGRRSNGNLIAAGDDLDAAFKDLEWSLGRFA